MRTRFDASRVMLLLSVASALMTWGPALWGWQIQSGQAYQLFFAVGPIWLFAALGFGLVGFCLSGLALFRRDWRGLVGGPSAIEANGEVCGLSVGKVELPAHGNVGWMKRFGILPQAGKVRNATALQTRRGRARATHKNAMRWKAQAGKDHAQTCVFSECSEN